MTIKGRLAVKITLACNTRTSGCVCHSEEHLFCHSEMHHSFVIPRSPFFVIVWSTILLSFRGAPFFVILRSASDEESLVHKKRDPSLRSG